AGVLTADLAFPLHDAILGFDAEHYVDGHGESVLSRPDIEGLIEKMRLAETAVREGSAIAEPDEHTDYFVQAFSAGRAPASSFAVKIPGLTRAHSTLSMLSIGTAARTSGRTGREG